MFDQTIYQNLVQMTAFREFEHDFNLVYWTPDTIDVTWTLDRIYIESNHSHTHTHHTHTHHSRDVPLLLSYGCAGEER